MKFEVFGNSMHHYTDWLYEPFSIANIAIGEESSGVWYRAYLFIHLRVVIRIWAAWCSNNHLITWTTLICAWKLGFRMVELGLQESVSMWES